MEVCRKPFCHECYECNRSELSSLALPFRCNMSCTTNVGNFNTYIMIQCDGFFYYELLTNLYLQVSI